MASARGGLPFPSKTDRAGRYSLPRKMMNFEYRTNVKGNLAVPLILFLVVAVLHSRLLFNGFINLDDPPM
jgi:hypothetical protein